MTAVFVLGDYEQSRPVGFWGNRRSINRFPRAELRILRDVSLQPSETPNETPRQPVNGLSELRELHILVSHQGVCRRLCKLAFSRTDASIYLFAYARHGNYFCGGRSLLERQAQD